MNDTSNNPEQEAVLAALKRSDLIGQEAISPLMADLMTASMTHTHKMTEEVIDRLTRERDEARAELEAVRAAIYKLHESPYVPHPNTYLDALYPDSPTIQTYMPNSGK